MFQILVLLKSNIMSTLLFCFEKTAIRVGRMNTVNHDISLSHPNISSMDHSSSFP